MELACTQTRSCSTARPPACATARRVQGMNANVRKAWLADARNAAKLEAYARAFNGALARMQGDPRGTTAVLARFYNISADAAARVYNSLWQANGLQASGCYDTTALANTESIFSTDTGIRVPEKRSWVNHSLSRRPAHKAGPAGSGGAVAAATKAPAPSSSKPATGT